MSTPLLTNLAKWWLTVGCDNARSEEHDETIVQLATGPPALAIFLTMPSRTSSPSARYIATGSVL
jgi:hypothetical protein